MDQLLESSGRLATKHTHTHRQTAWQTTGGDGEMKRVAREKETKPISKGGGGEKIR